MSGESQRFDLMSDKSGPFANIHADIAKWIADVVEANKKSKPVDKQLRRLRLSKGIVHNQQQLQYVPGDDESELQAYKKALEPILSEPCANFIALSAKEGLWGILGVKPSCLLNSANDTVYGFQQFVLPDAPPEETYRILGHNQFELQVEQTYKNRAYQDSFGEFQAQRVRPNQLTLKSRVVVTLPEDYDFTPEKSEQIDYRVEQYELDYEAVHQDEALLYSKSHVVAGQELEGTPQAMASRATGKGKLGFFHDALVMRNPEGRITFLAKPIEIASFSKSAQADHIQLNSEQSASIKAIIDYCREHKIEADIVCAVAERSQRLQGWANLLGDGIGTREHFVNYHWRLSSQKPDNELSIQATCFDPSTSHLAASNCSHALMSALELTPESLKYRYAKVQDDLTSCGWWAYLINQYLIDNHAATLEDVSDYLASKKGTVQSLARDFTQAQREHLTILSKNTARSDSSLPASEIEVTDHLDLHEKDGIEEQGEGIDFGDFEELDIDVGCEEPCATALLNARLSTANVDGLLLEHYLGQNPQLPILDDGALLTLLHPPQAEALLADVDAPVPDDREEVGAVASADAVTQTEESGQEVAALQQALTEKEAELEEQAETAKRVVKEKDQALKVAALEKIEVQRAAEQDKAEALRLAAVEQAKALERAEKEKAEALQRAEAEKIEAVRLASSKRAQQLAKMDDALRQADQQFQNKPKLRWRKWDSLTLLASAILCLLILTIPLVIVYWLNRAQEQTPVSKETDLRVSSTQAQPLFDGALNRQASITLSLEAKGRHPSLNEKEPVERKVLRRCKSLTS